MAAAAVAAKAAAPHTIARRLRIVDIEVAEVEQQRPTLEHAVDVDIGIAERRVDEVRIEAGETRPVRG